MFRHFPVLLSLVLAGLVLVAPSGRRAGVFRAAAGEGSRGSSPGPRARPRLRRRGAGGSRRLGRRRPGRADRRGGAEGRGDRCPRARASSTLPGTTLLPGLIDAHSHVLLHAYDEAPWDDQVLKEPLALRVCRATNHLRIDLLSGFTTLRDLGTEGAGYADVGLKQAVEQGIVPGPRLLVATRAIVATRSYAPAGFAPEVDVPQGAEEADGDALRRVVRDQIGRGADLIKVYADNARGRRPSPWTS